MSEHEIVVGQECRDCGDRVLGLGVDTFSCYRCVEVSSPIVITATKKEFLEYLEKVLPG